MIPPFAGEMCLFIADSLNAVKHSTAQMLIAINTLPVPPFRDHPDAGGIWCNSISGHIVMQTD
jgi:hypothetical protein